MVKFFLGISLDNRKILKKLFNYFVSILTVYTIDFNTYFKGVFTPYIF